MFTSRPDKKINIWRPSIGAQTPVVKFDANAEKARQTKVVNDMLERMRENGYTKPSGGRRTRKLRRRRGRKYSKKTRGRKSKKCGCSVLSFR